MEADREAEEEGEEQEKVVEAVVVVLVASYTNENAHIALDGGADKQRVS